jgi:hypothetical protein
MRDITVAQFEDSATNSNEKFYLFTLIYRKSKLKCSKFKVLDFGLTRLKI